VHIEKITLTNYRGENQLEIPLQNNFNVIYGMNGAGKSTLLDAAAIMLSWVVSRIRLAGTSGRPIQEDDISNTQSAASITVIASDHQEECIKWTLAKIRKGHLVLNPRSSLTKLNAYTKKWQEKITCHNENLNIPLFAYYPVNRAVLDIPLRIRAKHQFNLLEAYEGALTGGANFRTFFEWFREREDLENEARKYIYIQNHPDLSDLVDTQYPDPQLEAVRHALEKLMPDFKNLTVRRSPLRMEVFKNGKPLTVSQLSDGEKCLMAMVGDLARRLAIANPARENPLEGEAIVLIDEIDLHLHPKWQAMIIPRLQATFPNCQFIVSTHSPHIITHVKPESLYRLKQTDTGIELERPNESYGKNIDRILEDLMGMESTRPLKVSEDLHNIYHLISHNKIKEAQQMISDLRHLIGEDPELVKARVLILRKEIIGK
jgi:predicted ATP-binding protein involved in virulence